MGKPKWCGKLTDCPNYVPRRELKSWRDENGALCCPPKCECINKEESKMSEEIKKTPSAKWRMDALPDPHRERYDCERANLCMGDLTDDELANAAFMNYDVVPKLEEILANTAKMPIVYMTAVKDRIRWLSRALEKEIANNAAHAKVESEEEIKGMEYVRDYFSKYYNSATSTTCGSVVFKINELIEECVKTPAIRELKKLDGDIRRTKDMVDGLKYAHDYYNALDKTFPVTYEMVTVKINKMIADHLKQLGDLNVKKEILNKEPHH